MAWTDEQKTEAVETYKKANPTPETSTEIIKEIAETMSQSPNGVRMILVQAGVYVKKDPSATTTKVTKEGGTRVSKESQIAALKAAMTDNALDVDEEILEKLTGKAAAYFTKVITQALAEDE